MHVGLDMLQDVMDEGGIEVGDSYITKRALFASRPTILRFLANRDDDGTGTAVDGASSLHSMAAPTAAGTTTTPALTPLLHQQQAWSHSPQLSSNSLFSSTATCTPTGSCVCASLDSLVPSMASRLDVPRLLPHLQNQKVLSSEECAQVEKWNKILPKEETVKALMEMIKQSSLKNLRVALQNSLQAEGPGGSPPPPGHGDLVRMLESMGTCTPEGSLSEETDLVNVFDPVMEFKWKQAEPLPKPLKNVHAKLLGENVYIGGGTTGRIDLSSIVYKYNYATNSWGSLPIAPVYSFAMEVFNGELLLIGGREMSSSCVTNQLTAWHEGSQSWRMGSYYCMPTARHSASVTTWDQQYLLVAGGFTVESAINNVEIFSSATNQWMTAEPFPVRCSMMRSAKLASKWYLLAQLDGKGDKKALYSASLQSLVEEAEKALLDLPKKKDVMKYSAMGQQAKKQFFFVQSKLNTATKDEEDNSEDSLYCAMPVPVLWTKLSVPPLHSCSLVTYNGALLAIGGGPLSPRSSPVFAYSSDCLCWVQVSTLPLCVHGACPVVLPNGSMLLVGGATADFALSDLAVVGSLSIK